MKTLSHKHEPEAELMSLPNCLIELETELMSLPICLN